MILKYFLFALEFYFILIRHVLHLIHNVLVLKSEKNPSLYIVGKLGLIGKYHSF